MTHLLNHVLRLFGLRAVFFHTDSPKERYAAKHRQLAQELGREWPEAR